MGKGYAEGPAAEAAEEERDRRAGAGGPTTQRRTRMAVLGSTTDRPEKHLIGFADEVDPDELFRTGQAWGLSVTPIAV